MLQNPDAGQLVPGSGGVRKLRWERSGIGKRGGLRVIYFVVARIRRKSALSQAQFATALGVSKRTLEQWEQGRRNPSGAAKQLLKIAERHPEVLIGLAA